MRAIAKGAKTSCRKKPRGRRRAQQSYSISRRVGFVGLLMRRGRVTPGTGSLEHRGRRAQRFTKRQTKRAKRRDKKSRIIAKTYLKTGSSRVAGLLLGTIDAGLATGALAARRLSLSTRHFGTIRGLFGVGKRRERLLEQTQTTSSQSVNVGARKRCE